VYKSVCVLVGVSVLHCFYTTISFP